MRLRPQWVVADDTMGNPRKSCQALQHNYRSSIFNISSISPISTDRGVLTLQLLSQLASKLLESDPLPNKLDRCRPEKKRKETKYVFRLLIVLYSDQFEAWRTSMVSKRTSASDPVSLVCNIENCHDVVFNFLFWRTFNNLARASVKGMHRSHVFCWITVTKPIPHFLKWEDRTYTFPSTPKDQPRERQASQGEGSM